MNLGFYFDFDSSLWTAGKYYYQNMLQALKCADLNKQIRISFIKQPASMDAYRAVENLIDDVIELPENPSWEKSWFRFLEKKFTSYVFQSSSMQPILRSRKVDCVFAPQHFGTKFSIPLISNIFDFQYIHLPEMFSKQEIIMRDQFNTKLARLSRRVILSSESANQDFKTRCPESAQKARIMPFAVLIPDAVYETDPGHTYQHYHLPERFFFLPNQFWKHKNHLIILDALEMAIKTNPEIKVICSGLVSDHRQPAYPSELFTRVSDLNLRDHFIVLGLVPKNHMYALMRQSLAILQPSLFEGWSTSVEEAKSLGKKMILSKLPVHLEQNPPGATYFNPGDARELADLMTQKFALLTPGPDINQEGVFRQLSQERFKIYGEKLLACFLEPLNK